MLRYYSYYSVGGYKDFILGTSEDKQEATFYLPLLPVLEERAKTDEDAAKRHNPPQAVQLALQRGAPFAART